MAAAAVLELSPVFQRKISAIVGACVADAAAQPLHWIYKDDVMHGLTNGKEEIEFRVPSANPFYRIETGKNTCYGDQAYVMLKSLVQAGGLDIKQLTEATFQFFGPESDYESKETNSYVVGKEDKINIKKSLPIYGPWRHGCIKDFLKNLQEKKTPPGSAGDDQIDCAIRAIPLVALYAGRPEMLSKVEEGLRVLQESDMAIAAGLAMARILEQYILHGDPQNVLESVIAVLSDPDHEYAQELDRAVAGQIRQVVRAKDLPGSMQASLHGLLTAASYADGIRSTIRVGGCNASRSGFIGACMAAKDGFESIPESWRSRTTRYSETLDLALKLVQLQI